jgi:hypothetical protein
MMKNNVRQIIVLILTLLPMVAKAQWNFDVPTVEAYINDHKQQRSLLIARSTLEVSNKLLHEYSSTATVDYKTLNVDLDKYTRAFDVIDVLYQSLRTGLNIYSTYNSVSKRIVDYKNILSDYNDKVLKRGKVEITDTLIISINYRCIQKIADEGQQLYHSMTDLVLYATGAAACSTSDLMLVFTAINTSLDNIEKHLNSAYFETWRYIQLRMGYWKASVYRAQTKRQMADDAFTRWRQAGKDALNSKSSSSGNGLIILPWTKNPTLLDSINQRPSLGTDLIINGTIEGIK